MSVSRVKYIDLRRGNHDIHTADDMWALEALASSATSSVETIAVHPGTTEAIWQSPMSPSGKIVSADPARDFDFVIGFRGRVVTVQLHQHRAIYFSNIEASLGDFVVVAADRGCDIGRVVEIASKATQS